MVESKEMVRNLSIKNSDRLKKICEPLSRYFGVTHFAISRTMSDGHFFSIGSNLDFQDHYYTENLYKHSPLHRNAKFIQSGFYSYNHIKDAEFQKSRHQMLDKTHIEFVGGIAISHDNGVSRFVYGTREDIGSEKVIGLLQNNLPAVRKFNEYFVNETRDILNDALQHSIYLPFEMGEKYDLPPNTPLIQGIPATERFKFLEELGIISNNGSLTKREMECLFYLSKGLTCPQLAQKLCLSRRTVENNIEIIKQKLGCGAKSDLIEIAQLLHN